MPTLVDSLTVRDPPECRISRRFLELDPDESGSISTDEIMHIIGKRGVSRDAKRFLYALASGANDKVDLDVSTWKMPTSSVFGVREALSQHLQEHDPPGKISDLFFLMSNGNGGTLDKDQFRTAMRRIGLSHKPVTNALFEELFNSIDQDRSGQVGQYELVQWMSGAVSNANKVRSLVLMKPDSPPDEWNSDTLRLSLQQTLMKAHLAPVNLLLAWDADQGGQMERKEFVRNMKKLVADHDLWEDHLREVTQQTFETVAGGDNAINSEELQRWLVTGWKELKKQRDEKEKRRRDKADAKQEAMARRHRDDKKEARKKEGRALYLSRDAAAAFFEADVNGNEQLDFDEFAQAVPAELKASMSIDQITELFRSADTDGSGSISMDEFFLWTMSVVCHHTGTGIEAIFRSYDSTGEGLLDPAEFAAACEDLGFGAMAQDLCVSHAPSTRLRAHPCRFPHGERPS